MLYVCQLQQTFNLGITLAQQYRALYKKCNVLHTYRSLFTRQEQLASVYQAFQSLLR